MLFLLLLMEPGFGGEGSEQAERERRAMEARVSADRERTGNLLREEGSILQAIREVESKLEQQRKRIVDLSVQRARVEFSLRQAELELAEAESVLRTKREEVMKRAIAMLRLSRTPLAELLARARSPSEARRLKERMRFVLAHDSQVLGEAQRAGTKAKQARSTEAARQAELKVASEDLVREHDATRTTREERAVLLGMVRKERTSVERLMAEVQSAARRLDVAMSTPRGILPPPPPAPGGFGKQRGRLPWPVAGVVEAPFGKRVEPDSGMVIEHLGIDVRAPYGDGVKSVFSGRVVFAGPVPRFGEAVIIEHGDGWKTVYGHLDGISVGEGDDVEVGQELGAVGDSGSWKGAFLYFEIRRGRTAEDPLVYLAP